MLIKNNEKPKIKQKDASFCCADNKLEIKCGRSERNKSLNKT